MATLTLYNRGVGGTMNNKGSIETAIIIGMLIIILGMLVLLPVSCHQEITRKQAIMAKTGVEMSYWDIFWTDPQLRYNQGTLVVEGE